MEKSYRVEGMSCQHCVNAVSNVLRTVPGVQDIRVVVGEITVISAQAIPVDVIDKALHDEGYRLVH